MRPLARARPHPHRLRSMFRPGSAQTARDPLGRDPLGARTVRRANQAAAVPLAAGSSLRVTQSVLASFS